MNYNGVSLISVSVVEISHAAVPSRFRDQQTDNNEGIATHEHERNLISKQQKHQRDHLLRNKHALNTVVTRRISFREHPAKPFLIVPFHLNQ